MHQDPDTHPSYAMTEGELVSVLTREKHQYNDRFRAIAAGELARRGVDVETFLNQVEVRFEDDDPQAATIDQALSRLDGEAPLWSMWTFANCLEEALVIQKESRTWIVHHYAGEQYARSFFVPSRAAVRELLNHFLRLEDWTAFVGESHRLDAWKTLIHSQSAKYLAKVTTELDKAQVLYTVKPPIISGDEEKWLSVLVPGEEMAAADAVLDDIEKQIRNLYQRASELADTADRVEEVRIYDLLVEVVPHNPAVYYNRGSALLEMGHAEEAADSFIEAVSLIVGRKGREVNFSGRPARGTGGLGGTFGMAFLAFNSLFRARQREPAATPDYPELIDDAELFLLQLAEKLPKYTRIFHCLANISRLKQDLDEVERRYEQILVIDPQDVLARTNLDYLRSVEPAQPT